MPAPTTTGGGFMSYPATVDSGGVPPSVISNDSAMIGGNITSTLTANAVLLWAFELQASTIITGVRWHMGATTTGATNMGIYTASGNIVSGSDTGAISNSANTDGTASYSPNIVLAPGAYFMALACNNATDTYAGKSAGASTPTYRGRKATNVLSGGALPLTTGTIVATNLDVGCALVVSGGLP